MERVDYEMPRIIANILDPNTKATAKRKLTITMEFAPDDERTNIITNVTVKPSLAATNPVRTTLYASVDGHGEVQIVEMTPQVPGQTHFDGSEQEPPAMLKLVNFN